MKISTLTAAFVLTLAASTQAFAQAKIVYPQTAEEQHAQPAIAKILKDMFDAKSRHDVDGTMAFFSPDMLTYTDAVLGWPLDGYDALKGLFSTYMPKWPATGLSYPVKILGGPNSALVEFVNTKELFGSELHVFGVADMKQGKIVRWVDYWDGNTFSEGAYKQMRTAADKFPTSFKDDEVGSNETARMTSVATEFQTALAKGESKAAAHLLSSKAVFEDRTLHTTITDKSEIEAYFARALKKVPYGAGSELRHIVGGDLGGGFEWTATAEKPDRGVVALELDATGKITRVSVVYDGRQISSDQFNTLKDLSVSR